MKSLEKAGRRVLTFDKPTAPLKKRAINIARVYYRSEGGEVLCVESRPMTWHAANAFLTQYRPAVPSTYIRSSGHGALDVEIVVKGSTKPLRHCARLIAMPAT